jgi:biopolymer transport protein TolR
MAMFPRQVLGSRDDLVYRPSAEINVTPLVDVTLVLLIIFMVAAPLMMTGVRVDLPRTSASKIGQVKKPVIVTVAPDGSVYIRNEQVALNDLAARLDALRAAEGDAIVYIRADKGTDYGEVMDMLGRVNAAGYKRISLLAQAPAKEAASP